MLESFERGVIWKLNFQSTCLNQITLQDTDSEELSKQDTVPDVKYQDIVYYMHDIDKTVESKEKIHVDFLKAMHEMECLDWKYTKNFIGFTNERTNECVQFVRSGQDKWYAEVPIRHGRGWNGYVWCDNSDSKTIGNMVRLFFEEMPWFGMLSWKLKRLKKYAKD